MLRKNVFSIITPSWNQGSTIEETINSLLKQNLNNIQYILVDAISSDNTLEVLQKYRPNLSQLIIEPDSGQSEAINKGIKLATGNIINWMNSDDYYESDALSIVAKNFDDPNVKVLMGKSRLFQNEKTISYSRGTDVYPGNLPKTIGWCRIDQPETFFRKEAWNKVGLLNEQLHYTMDREWWMRYLYIFGLEGIKKIDDVLVNFRLHDQSKTVSQNEKFQIEHDTIFYILSTLLDNKNYQDLLSTNLKIDFSIDSEIKKWTDKEIIEGSFNYYLLKRAEVFYYQGNHSTCKDFLKFVNINLLAKEDQKLLNKIKFRSKLPQSLISLFRK